MPFLALAVDLKDDAQGEILLVRDLLDGGGELILAVDLKDDAQGELRLALDLRDFAPTQEFLNYFMQGL